MDRQTSGRGDRSAAWPCAISLGFTHVLYLKILWRPRISIARTQRHLAVLNIPQPHEHMPALRIGQFVITRGPCANSGAGAAHRPSPLFTLRHSAGSTAPKEELVGIDRNELLLTHADELGSVLLANGLELEVVTVPIGLIGRLVAVGAKGLGGGV